MDNPIFTAPGELVSANGSNYHVRRLGGSGPVIILECGLTMMSACWGWLAPELANFARVITYDRAGLGWSDEREGVRDWKQLASELAGLLRVLGVNEPVVLLGHSMGALIHRELIKQEPKIARAVVWLDPAHPEQMKRQEVRRRMRNLVLYIQAAQFLATKGVPAIEAPLIRHCQGLPEGEYRTLRQFFRNPRHLRTTAREVQAWELSSEFLQEETLKHLPVLIVSGQRSALPGWEELQRELACLSKSTQHVSLPEFSHISMLANHRHAMKVIKKIRRFLEGVAL